MESASERIGPTSYYTHRELDALNKTTDYASKDYKKVVQYWAVITSLYTSVYDYSIIEKAPKPVIYNVYIQ